MARGYWIKLRESVAMDPLLSAEALQTLIYLMVACAREGAQALTQTALKRVAKALSRAASDGKRADNNTVRAESARFRDKLRTLRNAGYVEGGVRHGVTVLCYTPPVHKRDHTVQDVDGDRNKNKDVDGDARGPPSASATTATSGANGRPNGNGTAARPEWKPPKQTDPPKQRTNAELAQIIWQPSMSATDYTWAVHEETAHWPMPPAEGAREWAKAANLRTVAFTIYTARRHRKESIDPWQVLHDLMQNLKAIPSDADLKAAKELVRAIGEKRTTTHVGAEKCAR